MNNQSQIQSQNQSQNQSQIQSQGHGFTFENDVRKTVFDLPVEKNNTEKHDIPKNKNRFNENENCSIKTTGSGTICCSSIISFYNYDFTEKNTIIVIKYRQEGNLKVVKRIYEIDYNLKCHKLLFGNLTKEVIENYIEKVKTIPKNIKGKEAKKIFNYLVEKKKIKKEYPSIIQINPKVDRKQSRVQCSISGFEKKLKDFITYISPIETPNLLRGKKIVSSIESSKRRRNKKT